MTATNVPRLTKVGDVDWDSIDAAFCCLPHATTQEILNSLPKHVKVVDLSADFRLKDVNLYAEWCAAPVEASMRSAAPCTEVVHSIQEP